MMPDVGVLTDETHNRDLSLALKLEFLDRVHNLFSEVRTSLLACNDVILFIKLGKSHLSAHSDCLGFSFSFLQTQFDFSAEVIPHK